MRNSLTAILVIALWAPTAAFAKFSGGSSTFKVDCDSGRHSITDALELARDGDTILVRGTCKESITVDKGVTLDGGGEARIAPAAPDERTITVTARDVTVRGFRLDAPALFQVFVFGGAGLTVESTTIRNAANFGISAASNSYVVLLRNVITDNGLGGIIGLSGAELSIGMRLPFDPPTGSNVIADNGQFGVVLVSNAGARILGGNTISGHEIGVLVADGAQARIAGNIIDGNTIGILNDAGGVTTLPLVSNVVAAFVEPNSGENTRFGIACRGGTLRGVPDGLSPAVRLPPVPGVLEGPSDGLATHCLDQTESR